MIKRSKVLPYSLRTALKPVFGIVSAVTRAHFKVFLRELFFKPRLFFGLMDGLNSAGLLESSIVKFVQTQMETRSKRAQVYFTWRVFGRIQLHLGKIIRQLRKNKTPVELFIGKYDRMVTEQKPSPIFIQKYRI